MANRGCVEVSRKSEKPQAANTVPARSCLLKRAKIKKAQACLHKYCSSEAVPGIEIGLEGLECLVKDIHAL